MVSAPKLDACFDAKLYKQPIGFGKDAVSRQVFDQSPSPIARNHRAID